MLDSSFRLNAQSLLFLESPQIKLSQIISYLLDLLENVYPSLYTKNFFVIYHTHVVCSKQSCDLQTQFMLNIG